MASAKHDGWFLPSGLRMKTEDTSQRQSEDFYIHKGTYLCKAETASSSVTRGEGEAI